MRKKAVMALHSFYMKDPSAIPDVVNHVTKAVRDKDPGVMIASLQLFFELIKVKRTAGNIDCSILFRPLQNTDTAVQANAASRERLIFFFVSNIVCYDRPRQS